MPKLGINIDHIATLRQARRGIEPDPVSAALICLKSGANSIVAHLREDRRHIQDADIYALRKAVKNNFNLEMSIDPSVVKVAFDVCPDQVTLVPERRQELTTEGGLDAAGNFRKLKELVADFNSRKIIVSLFVAPDRKQIEACLELKAAAIEIHTGCYAEAKNRTARAVELKKIRAMSQYGHGLGLIINAGHGLNYKNTPDIARIPEIVELNIGHSVIARSVTSGLNIAVKEMKILCKGR